MIEEWRDVIGFEGAYQVSNLGRVRSLDRDIPYINNGTSTILHYKGKVLKSKPDRDGYPRVGLKFGKNVKLAGIHRLVAQAFLPNPDNLPCVNHKDYQRDNNCVNNLEWCSVDYNNHYSENQERRPHEMYVNIGKTTAKYTAHPVRCIETGQIFPSMIEAERQLGLGSGIVCYSIQQGKPTKSGYTFEKLHNPNLRR
jgi:hypothetical protein